MNAKLKVTIIEDKKYFCNHIMDLLSKHSRIEKVLCYHSVEECSEKDLKESDIFLIDILLPKASGIDFLKTISQINPSSKKIMLTALDSEDTIFQCLKLGCIGYILKSEAEKVSSIIDIIIEGGAYMTPSIAVRVMHYFQKQKKESKPENMEELSNRELQILKELAQGSSPSEIAALLLVSISTIRFHIRGIYQKLEVNNRLQML
ncbi:MAG TPA: response regulator transcription factor, partial [Leptospiraceae bacterium]|nr:response regulator transcription factor [Leptospiraceae bacterium]